jgi:hypothetical protein
LDMLKRLDPVATFEFSTEKRYLLLVKEKKSPEYMREIQDAFTAAGLNILFITGMEDEKWKAFELK